MKKLISYILFSSIILVFVGCKSKATSITPYHSNGVECMGVELDGSQTLRSTGIGRNKSDAVEQAKKNAIHYVLFKGISKGMQGCDLRPLINEVNAEEKYKEYFNIFFMDKGEYRKYVSAEDARPGSNVKNKAGAFVNYIVTVRVLRNELESRLKDDNVLK